MKRLRKIIARFVVRCVVENYKENGELRQLLQSELRPSEGGLGLAFTISQKG